MATGSVEGASSYRQVQNGVVATRRPGIAVGVPPQQCSFDPGRDGNELPEEALSSLKIPYIKLF